MASKNVADQLVKRDDVDASMDSDVSKVSKVRPADNFPVTIRTNIRKDGKAQDSYNGLVLNIEAVLGLEALSAYINPTSGELQFGTNGVPMDSRDSTGQHWINTTIDPNGLALIRRLK